MPKKFDLILSEGLLEKGLMNKEACEVLLKEADTLGVPLAQLLIERASVPEKDILNIFGEKLKIPLVDLKEVSVPKVVLDKVPVKIASYYRFIPLAIQERVLTIAVPTPLDLKLQDEIRTQLGYEVAMVLASTRDIVEGLKKFYGLAAETLEKIVSQAPKEEAAFLEPSQEKIEDIEKLAEDASVIKLVNQIILEAWRKRVTDIHFEPYRQGVNLRYRIDGLLYDANVGPEIKNFLNAIISRIKIMSNLNIMERRLPQDGRAIVKVADKVLDLRISTLPTPFGESIVIRILPTQMLFSLEKLGLSKKDLVIFENLIQKPHGIIFVTGPTGSGKTTTLYACLSRINTRERKIVTIEDPIEYEMPGIIQIQVMPDIGLDFARGLRSVLRHDPDIMMVGEARDLETAEIAIRVALTGHLVFSTLHTNDAASGVTRLIDIGIEPYLVASSVEAFIAQRLIRVVCSDCKYEDKSAPHELKELIAEELDIDPGEVTIFRGKGCPSCNFTGFFGRTAIYEILLVDDALKELILKKASAGQIKQMAVAKGMRTLRQDGWQRVLSGMTVPDEVMKVTSALEHIEAEGKTSGLPLDFPTEATFPLQEPDRRAFQRLTSKVNITYKIYKSQEELRKRGFKLEEFSVTKDISAGGLLFVSNESLAIGWILELKIELPDGEEPVACLARVVRTEELEEKRQYDIGVCFLDITGAARTRLKNL